VVVVAHHGVLTCTPPASRLAPLTQRAPDNIVWSINPMPQDVVTANPESWSFPPFQLTREGDKLMGRGVTDCLGHVALLTELMRQLGLHKPPLKHSVMAVFIANEENATVREQE
jgi:acetylornithine deacetylase